MIETSGERRANARMRRGSETMINFSRRLSATQSPPGSSIDAIRATNTGHVLAAAPYAAELHELRAELERKWATFQEVTDPHLGDAVYREVLATDARLQALVVRAQREMQAVWDADAEEASR